MIIFTLIKAASSVLDFNGSKNGYVLTQRLRLARAPYQSGLNPGSDLICQYYFAPHPSDDGIMTEVAVKKKIWCWSQLKNILKRKFERKFEKVFVVVSVFGDGLTLWLGHLQPQCWTTDTVVLGHLQPQCWTTSLPGEPSFPPLLSRVWVAVAQNIAHS